MKSIYCLVISVTLVICSCSKIPEKDVIKKEEPRKYVILLGEVEGFDINKFSENPFNGNIKVPGYLSNDLLFLSEDDYSNFIRSEKIVKSPNGEYPAYIFVGPMYTLQYSSIGAEGNTRKMLRTILRIENNRAELKYGIKIGDSIDSTLKKLPKNAVGENISKGIHYYFVLGEEISIHFEEDNEKLIAVEIQIGT